MTDGLVPVVRPEEPAPPAGARRRGRPGRTPVAWRHRAGTVLVALVGVFFAFPALYLAWESTRLGGDLVAVVATPAVLGPLAASLLLASTCAVAAMVLGTGLAVLVTRTDVHGRGALRVALALPLVIPSFVGATAWLAATGPGGLVPFLPRPEGFWGAAVVLTLLTYPYVYLVVLARLRLVSRNHEEAARLLGAGPFRTVLTVLVPQLRAATAAGGLLVFLYVLSDFGAVALLRYDTITRALYASRLLDRTTSVTLGLFLAVLAVLVALAARSAAAAPPGPRPARPAAVVRLGRLRAPLSLVPVTVVGLALVAPVVVLAWWALRGSATTGVGYSGPGDSLAFLVAPALGSVGVSVAAAVAAVLVVLPLAVASVRRPSATTRAVVAVVTSVFALPGLVVALALVFFALQAPGPLSGLYQTFPLLVLGYVLHFGAQALRASQTAVAAVPGRLGEAARTLGAGPARRFLTVDLPLVVPGLVAGAGLVLLSTLKELPATALLAPTGFETLATRIFFAAQDGFFAEVGVTSLVLLAMSAVLTWLLVLRPELGPSRRATDDA
ncbi:ABC transporter permease [Aquipuribacter nitratireducens]|uniref:ABC transporter permease n=1 Tax=Aquipuribacter nitratireducens TaxID=650104 RepID=A0ABW0GM36_9MICO